MRNILLFSALLYSTFLLAQKNDNVWLLGYDSNTYPAYPGVDRIKFTFNDSLVITNYGVSNLQIWETNTSICDSSGNLLLASNGCYVVDSNENIINGSTGLNPGFMYNNFCAEGYGYNAPQSMITLPDPGNVKKYHIFHLPSVKEGNRFYYRNLLHTEVESTSPGGWAMLQKNHPVVLDTLDPHGLHAVKHANGRDWWIVSIRERTNRFYFTLLTPDTIITHYQEIGPYLSKYTYGEIAFSTEGTKLAVFDAQNDLRIYDFDRCEGLLSNFVHVPIVDNADNEVFAGLAWSADSRFIYCSEVKRVLQFDISSTDITSSGINIGERTAATCSFQPGFIYAELTPDGRVFIRSAGGGTSCVHIIQNPERKGEACYLAQNSISTLPTYYSGLPHFPNFRLGPVDGSSCDTLGLDNHPLSGWRYDRAGGNIIEFTSVSWYEPDTWLWDFGDGTQSSERNPTHAYLTTGSYEVCLTVSNEYGSDTKCKTVWVTTVSDTEAPELSMGMKLYPNPTTGVVSWNGYDGETFTVQAFNQLGQLVAERQATANTLLIGDLQEGVYQLRFLTSKGELIATKSVSIVH